MVALYGAYVLLNAVNPAIVAALDRRAAAQKAAARPRLPSQHGEAATHMQDSAMVSVFCLLHIFGTTIWSHQGVRSHGVTLLDDQTCS